MDYCEVDEEGNISYSLFFLFFSMRDLKSTYFDGKGGLVYTLSETGCRAFCRSSRLKC